MPSQNPSHSTSDSTVFLGFWIYLMTDCVLFATLFAVYAVLHGSTFGGPSAAKLFNLPYVLAETMILLTSSFTCGLAMLAAHRKQKWLTVGLFVLTLLLGLTFLYLELSEFSRLAATGNSWQRSGFLSSYFSLVGTHGLHIFIGSIWILVCLAHTVRRGLTDSTLRKLTCLSLFWHFLDIVWIFIFTFVYLMGSNFYA